MPESKYPPVLMSVCADVWEVMDSIGPDLAYVVFLAADTVRGASAVSAMIDRYMVPLSTRIAAHRWIEAALHFTRHCEDAHKWVAVKHALESLL